MTDIDIKAIAASVADELTEHPERWTQGHAAINEAGDEVSPVSNSACRWCLFGHLDKRGAVPGRAFLEPGRRSAVQSLHDLFCPDHPSIATWNDDPSRTVSDVIALCRKIAQESK